MSFSKQIVPRLQDLMPSRMVDPEHNPHQALKPSAEETHESIEKTRAALQQMVSSKISASLPSRGAERTNAPQYIRYTPSEQGAQFNSGASQRIIRMVEVQQDPMEPPKFKINAKLPQAPGSPPPAVMHSPPRKITVKEQQEWKIPPCISNWKNAKGYTIPLDKRLAADGRGLQQTHVNEKFSKLAEVLYIAERKSREEIDLQNQEQKRLAQKLKEEKEEKLRRLAQKAREERAGIRQIDDSDDDRHDDDDDDRVEIRDQIREKRQRERQRERNLQRAAPDKRNRLERERDITEEIALGLAGSRPKQGELQFDQRLFNQSKGVGSGFGDDDEYGVYDKPWRSQAQFQQNLYRPKRSMQDDTEDLEALASSSRFVPEKGFSGADKSAKRDGPVEFQKAATSSSSASIMADEDDPFGLNKLLTDAKKASNPRKDETKYEHRGSYKRSRRD